VTNLAGLPKSLYEKIYCARGQAENLIKAHKLHLDANQFRLLTHTAAAVSCRRMAAFCCWPRSSVG